MAKFNIEKAKQEIIRRVHKLGIKEVLVDLSPSSSAPKEYKYGIDIGVCPFSWHFYAPTRIGVLKKALEWIKEREENPPRCMCDMARGTSKR